MGASWALLARELRPWLSDAPRLLCACARPGPSTDAGLLCCVCSTHITLSSTLSLNMRRAGTPYACSYNSTRGALPVAHGVGHV